MKEKIGVYICHCGSNIADYVDVRRVREIVENEPGVFLSKDMMFTCADSSQKEMIEDIKSNNIDAIVVASCSPKLHLYTFRNVAERSGLNPYNYVQCNIREQCSWAHTDKPQDATEKAIRLVRAAIARVRFSKALESITIEAQNSVLIIGAGVSGMRAAIELTDMGTEVFLIEKNQFIGGRVAQMGDLFTTDEKGEEIISKLIKEMEKRRNINLFTGSELEQITGIIGHYKAKIKVTPRYIPSYYNKAKICKAIDECTDEIIDEFNFGLTKRKAIYKAYEKAYPDIHVIDKDIFKPDSEFLEKYKDCIDPGQECKYLELNIGAVILCTGFDPYEPEEGEYGYKKVNNVITLQQFKRLIELSNEKLEYNNKEIKNITFIYCVGSRQNEGDNKYCSRYCCTAAIHTSLNIKKKFDNIRCSHLFRDIRTYGKQELLYDESCRKGDIFIKFDSDEPPIVENEDDNIVVKINDILTEGEEIEIYPDLVVLVTGMVPRKDSHTIASILKNPVGLDKFFNEVHPKLKPVETVINGIYIAGTCQGPKNIAESVKSSLAAAAKANALISSGKIELEPTLAKIDPEICVWCDKCSEVCPFDSISKTEHNGKLVAVVNEAACKGCGMCTPVCPVDAIDIIGYTNMEIESMIDALIKEVKITSKADEEKVIIEEEKKIIPTNLNENWKIIVKALESGPKTIPQVAEETNLPLHVVTYNLMSCRKYGYIEETGEPTDEDYYLYKLKE